MEKVAALEIISPGPLTTIQDLGRQGHGRYGVPPSGAVDPFSLRIANLLVGNREQEACLETTLMGLKAGVLTDLVIAITGGDLQPHINDAPCMMWQSLVARKGDLLHFKAVQTGCRAYLAIAGGIRVDPVLGSKSTNLISGFGGYEGRRLKEGDVLFTSPPCSRFYPLGKILDQDKIPVFKKHSVLRILWGPQAEDFTPESKTVLLDSVFSVTPMSDRTGIRLSGPLIQRKEGISESIISEGVIAGSVQVPGDGQPIIILVETVTGGYRKIATVIGADIPLLGQVKPGDLAMFRALSQKQALQALRETERTIAHLKEE